jgi:hypothetical protein
MKLGFNKIFLGLLFIILDIRLNSIDLFLPDFVGYILIASGLGLLAPRHKWFRRARVLAIIMIGFSLIDFIEVKVDASQAPIFRREWTSVLTGDLASLLPQQVASANLLRTTTSANEINTNRTHNPERDKDRVLAEYSDGTLVLVLRYASPDEALAALKQKQETDYSLQGFRKRAETDAAFKTDKLSSQGGSSGGRETTSAYSKIEGGDGVIQQWWNRGRTWWNPISWRNKGGWSGNLLYIVEGHRSSADAFESAFEGGTQSRNGSTFDPLFPISTAGRLVNILLIWALCSGVIALSAFWNNYGLMQSARRRRNFYIIVEVSLLIMSFIAPDAVLGVLGIPYVFGLLLSVILIMLLMRRAANTLPESVSLDHQTDHSLRDIPA